MTIKTLITCYILSELSRIEDEKTQHKNNIRYRNIDICDTFEYTLLLNREECFRTFASNILNIIKISSDAETIEKDIEEYIKSRGKI